MIDRALQILVRFRDFVHVAVVVTDRHFGGPVDFSLEPRPVTRREGLRQLTRFDPLDPLAIVTDLNEDVVRCFDRLQSESRHGRIPLGIGILKPIVMRAASSLPGPRGPTSCRS